VAIDAVEICLLAQPVAGTQSEPGDHCRWDDTGGPPRVVGDGMLTE
jgi:hypothetical protein